MLTLLAIACSALLIVGAARISFLYERWAAARVLDARCDDEPPDRVQVFADPKGDRVLIRVDHGEGWGDVYMIGLTQRAVEMLQPADGRFLLSQAFIRTDLPVEVPVHKGSLKADLDPDLRVWYETDTTGMNRIHIEFSTLDSGRVEVTLDGGSPTFAG